MRKLVFLLSVIWSCSVLGQSVKKVPVKVVLDRLEEEYNINFSYDASLVELLSIADKFPSGLDTTINQLSRLLPLQFEKASDSYFLVTAKAFSFQIQLIDSLEKTALGSQYATILINGNPYTAGQTDNSGNYSFEYKINSKDSLSVFILGFEPEAMALNDLLSGRSTTYHLAPKTVYLGDVVIQDYLSRGIDLNPSSQSISISVEDLPALPGETDGDIFASLAALPGISTPDNRAGNLFIRGSSTDQSLILFDNIPIYHNGHYFGTISPYNPKMVDQVNVYKSGMHPRYGGRVGGAIEIQSSEAQAETRAGLGVNTLYGVGYFKSPLFKNKIGLAVGGRHSLPSQWNSPKLDAITDVVYVGSVINAGVNGQLPSDFEVVFEDYNAKLSIPLSKKSTLEISGIHAENNMKYLVLFDSTGNGIRSKTGFTNSGANAILNTEFRNGMKYQGTATVSDYKVKFAEQNALSQKAAINEILDLNTRQELRFGSTAYFSQDVGIDYSFQRVSSEYDNPRSGYLWFTNPYAHTISPYFNTVWNVVSRLSVQAGLRASYYSQKEKVYFQPRIMATYDLSNQVMLKSSYGYYHQFLSQARHLEFSSAGFENQLWKLAYEDFHIVHGQQASLGFLYSKNRLVVDIEGYYKTANNIDYSSSKLFEFQTEFTTADQEAYGVDCFMKTELNENLSGWVGYSLSKLELNFDTLQSVSYPSKYDQPHKINLGLAYTKSNLEISVGWRFVSGQYVHSAEFVSSENRYYQNRPDSPNNPTPGRRPSPYDDISERLDPVHSLDISASYELPKTQKRPFKSTYGLSLINVYNQDNQTDYAVRNNDGINFLERNAIGFAPNLMVMIEF